MIIQDEIASFDTANLGATARAPLQVGRRTYHGLLLQADGVSAYATGGSAGVLDFRHAVEYVELFVSGKSKLMVKPSIHHHFMEHLNITDDPMPTNFLSIPLSRPGILNSDWATGDMESLQIAVKLKSSLPTGTGGNASLSRIRGWQLFEDLDAPVPRGNVFTKNVITPATPVAGWNTIDNLTVGSLHALRALLFVVPPTGTNTTNTGATAITQVKVSIAGKTVYNGTRAYAEASLVHNPFYKWPTTSLGFPVFLDLNNRVEDLAGMVQGNVRYPVKVEYYWDTGIASVTPVDILVDGLELGTELPKVSAQ